MNPSTIAKNLLLIYYAAFMSVTAIAFAGWYVLKSGVRIDPYSETGIIISSIFTVFIMGSTPVSLWLFQRFTKKLQEITEVKTKLKKYQTGAIARIMCLEFAAIAGVVFYYIMSSQSMLIASAIAIVGLFLSKPSENKIIADLQLDNCDTEEQLN